MTNKQIRLRGEDKQALKQAIYYCEEKGDGITADQLKSLLERSNKLILKSRKS